MITLDKWYPMVLPKQYDVKQAAFDQAVERVQEEYKQALKANKIEKATMRWRWSFTINAPGRTPLSLVCLRIEDDSRFLYKD